MKRSVIDLNVLSAFLVALVWPVVSRFSDDLIVILLVTWLPILLILAFAIYAATFYLNKRHPKMAVAVLALMWVILLYHIALGRL